MANGDLNNLRIEVLARIKQTETTLLKEFRRWAIPVAQRQRAAEVRMNMLEERVSELERGDRQ